MLSKKVFLAGELNFSAPPARPTRANVRDHIESQEGDRGASYASDRDLQQQAAENRLSRDLGSCSIFDFFDSIGPQQKFAAMQRDDRSRGCTGSAHRAPVCQPKRALTFLSQ